MNHWFDNLQSRICTDQPLPCARTKPSVCVTTEDVERVAETAEWEQYYISYNQTILKLGLGTLLEEIWQVIRPFDQINNVKRGSSPTNHLQQERENSAKFSLFSGHDNTLVFLLNALQIGDKRWPPFASNLVFEQWQNERAGKQVVVVKYNGVEQKIPECSNTWCPTEEFVNIISKFFWKDYFTECFGDNN